METRPDRAIRSGAQPGIGAACFDHPVGNAQAARAATDTRQGLDSDYGEAFAASTPVLRDHLAASRKRLLESIERYRHAARGPRRDRGIGQSD
jgi:hypothetical protein